MSEEFYRDNDKDKKESSEKALKDWAEKSIPILKENGFLEEKEESNKFAIISVIILGLAFLSFLWFVGYQIRDGKFQSSYQTSYNSTCEPYIDVPECPACPSLPQMPTCPTCPECKLTCGNST